MICKNPNVFNFRQLGGIVNSEGKRIKENIFFRGGNLEEVSREDKEILDALKLVHIMDFRGIEEAKGKDYVPDSCDYCHFPALKPVERKDSLDIEDLSIFDDSYMESCYHDLPFCDAYKKIMTWISKQEVPFYFHCSMGKDRTGVCAALILKLFDVKEEDIIKDYVKTNEYVKKEYGDNVSSAMIANENWLRISFDSILEKYGSYEEYYWKEFGIDQKEKERLKQIYCE